MSLGELADLHDQSLEFASQPPCGIKVAASLRDVPRGISTVWFTLCSATVFQHSSSQIWLSGSVNPFMPAGYLIPELGSSMKSTSDLCRSGLPSESPLMRSEISEKRHLHSLKPFKYIFRKTLGLSHWCGSTTRIHR